ncbi:hypothetical protein E2C01_032116 [Portunus trituberculatus]|uniref:Uncharacterized protein n=1 Tax=Portunus trituberculatus TaxID=210409 RepID=A0A5B7EYU3_PORTR|nr:hypothetical protein [Portunus trituberculatus]
MLGGLESYVFDDVVEFLFQQLGEELPYARSRYNNLYHYESEDYYSLPSEYINRKDSGQSCIGMAGNTGSSTICLNVFSALCVAGLALLMQFLFFACVSNLCPGIMNSSSGSGAAYRSDRKHASRHAYASHNSLFIPPHPLSQMRILSYKEAIQRSHITDAAAETVTSVRQSALRVIESNPTPTPIDHAFSDARTITTHARHGHLLHGMMGDLESYVFDDVVEFLFQQLGEELPQARSHQYYRHPDYNFEGGDNYPLPSQYSRPQPEDKSCISMGGNTNSIMCLNVLTALSIAGLGLLLQFLFFAGLSTLSSNNLSNSTSSGSEPNNISNVFSVTASNDVSVEQNDDIDIINRPDFEDDRLRSGIQRSDLDEDVNLGCPKAEVPLAFCLCQLGGT